jgi:hypothetical protein
MNPILRRVLVPSLALVGSLFALPSVAHADPIEHRHESRERERERERLERERRERAERERLQAERRRVEHERMCVAEHDRGAPPWRLRELGCWVR